MINKIANKLLFIFTGTDLNHQIKVWNDLKYDSDVSIANKDSKIKDLEYEIQNLSNLTLERNTLQSQLDETNKENAELNKRISSIQVYLEDIQKQKEHLINNFNGFEIAKNNEISDLTTKIENLEGQISRTQEVFEKDKLDFIREKQLMIDNNHQLTIEIDNLTEKIKYRDQTNVDLRVERDNLKTQLKKCLDELALLNNKEQEQQLQEEDNQQQKQREEKVKKIINAGIKLGEAANSESETETKADNTILKYEGLLEIELDYVFENINSHNGFIKWIFDAENNKYFQVLPAFFKQEDFVLVDLRLRLEDYCTNHQGKPKFVCAICYEPIKLSGNHGERGKVNCFVHSHDNINCPIITGSNRNINVRLFAESRQYQFSASLYSSKIIRKQLAIFLQNTPNIANYTAEPIISYNFNFAVWRKPHFSCEYKGHHIAFEVQTNSSTIKVVTSRNLFYRKQNSFILWIFDDSFASSKSLSLKDIFYANNHNIFVFDKIAQEKSESTNELWLKCIWEEPYIDENTISWEKKSDYITLDQLTYDTDNYIAYYYPSEEKYINLGGKVSYQVNLNNNSFADYEDTFEDLQKSNFDRLKSSGILTAGLNEIIELSLIEHAESDFSILNYDISYADLNGKFICRQNNHWYKVQRETLIGEKLPYQNIEEFDGVLKCNGTDSCDLISYDGKLLYSFKCTNLTKFLDNQFLAEYRSSYGWYNSNYEEVLPIMYEKIERFNYDYVLVRKKTLISLYFYNGNQSLVKNCSVLKTIDDDNDKLRLFTENKWWIYSLKLRMIVVEPKSDMNTALNELKIINRKISETVKNKQTFLYGNILTDKGDYYDVDLITISGKAKLYKVDVTSGTVKAYNKLLDENKITICKVILFESKNDVAILSQKIAKDKNIRMINNALKNIGSRENLEIIGTTKNQKFYIVQNDLYYGTISKKKIGENAIGYKISARIKEIYYSNTIAFELVEVVKNNTMKL